MKKYIGAEMVAHSRYVDFVATLQPDRRDGIVSRIDELVSTYGNYCDSGNYGHLCNIFSAIAIYEMHLADGKGREEAVELTAQPMWDFVERHAGPYRKLFGKPGMLKLLGWLVPKMFAKGSGTGWRYSWHEHTSTTLRFYCHECIYQQIFAHYGVTELGPIFCHADDINYGHIPGVLFTREHTLCRDGQPCDFLFEKK